MYNVGVSFRCPAKRFSYINTCGFFFVFFFFRFSAKHFLRPGEGGEPPGYVIGLCTVLWLIIGTRVRSQGLVLAILWCQ